MFFIGAVTPDKQIKPKRTSRLELKRPFKFIYGTLIFFLNFDDIKKITLIFLTCQVTQNLRSTRYTEATLYIKVFLS